jgi:LacI family transcriptional regulator
LSRIVPVRQVAREAGVSPATASRVLSGRGPASDEARRKVVAAARRLRHLPSTPAWNGIGPSYALALFVPLLSNPFYGELAEGAESAARRLGYHLIVVNIAEDPARQREEIEALRARGIDGFLFTTAEAGDRQILEMARQGYPMAVLTRELPELDVHCVVTDEFRGGALAAQHVVELGHRRIVAIAEPSAFIGTLERVRGAFVCHNDMVAIGVLQACRECARRVPEDVSVVGYDCTILARATQPPLTSVAQPTRDIGAVGVELVHQLLGSTVRVARKVVLQPTLWVGQTTGPPAG